MLLNFLEIQNVELIERLKQSFYFYYFYSHELKFNILVKLKNKQFFTFINVELELRVFQLNELELDSQYFLLILKSQIKTKFLLKYIRAPCLTNRFPATREPGGHNITPHST